MCSDSLNSGATPKDYRVLPDRIFLVRHAESEGNVDNLAYTTIPDSQVPLTERGVTQAQNAGLKASDSKPLCLKYSFLFTLCVIHRSDATSRRGA